jgi:hypothetical protein
MNAKFSVIFDNGGGVTLQVGKRGFVHNYSDPAQAANDVKVLLEDGNTRGWEGDEPQCRIEYDADIERNGGYSWHSQDDVKHIIKMGKWDHPWGYNGRKFYESLGVSIED